MLQGFPDVHEEVDCVAIPLIRVRRARSLGEMMGLG